MESVMRGDRGQLVGRFGALGFVLALLLIALPSPAYAQVDAIDSVGDKVDETVDETTDTVDETVGSVENTVDENAGPEGSTVDQVTDVVSETAGNAGNSVDDATDQTTDTVSKTTGGRLDDVVDDTAGRAGPVVDSLLSRGDERSPQLGATTGRRATTTGRRDGTQVRSAILDGFVGGIARTPLADRTESDLSAAELSDAGVVRRSTIDRLIENVGNLAPQVAFPVALVLLVAAFLVVQGRVDRSDPKLALASVDIDQDYLSFR